MRTPPVKLTPLLTCAFRNTSTNDQGEKEMPFRCKARKCSGVLAEAPLDDRKHCFFEWPRRNMSVADAIRVSEAQL